jgi:hypothetical protein
MNPIRRMLTTVVAALGLPLRAGAQSRTSPDEAGKQLRQMILGTKATDLGLKPTPAFPRVFGAIMDWPVGDQIATVVALSDGTASLYTTSTFGIIGGQAHETVRAAGKRFIETAERHYDEATLAVSYPYPAADQIAFYLLCYDGVRVVTAALTPTQAGTSRHVPLFIAAQEVLTQLRRTVVR